MTTSDYQWTVASALYQLRWEPTGRRASATAYLREAITTGPEQQARDIAYTLLSMTEPDEGDDVYQYQAIQGTCAVCHGPLEQSERYPAAGLLHVNDADDTHVPVLPAGPDFPLIRSASGYRDDLRLLVQLIPEEIQNDDSYFAAQRLLSLVNATEVMTDPNNQLPARDHDALCSSNITGESRCNCVQPEDRST